jgi:hypothetical protein
LIIRRGAKGGRGGSKEGLRRPAVRGGVWPWVVEPRRVPTGVSGLLTGVNTVLTGMNSVKIGVKRLRTGVKRYQKV